MTLLKGKSTPRRSGGIGPKSCGNGYRFLDTACAIAQKIFLVPKCNLGTRLILAERRRRNLGMTEV